MKPLAWFGPVSILQAQPSTPAGYSLHVLPCLGDKPPTCADHARSWKDSEGRYLPRMRARLRTGVEPVTLAAFSAGGACLRRLMIDKRDRDEVAGVALFDATFGERDASGGLLLDDKQRALVSFAVECIADGRPLVMTASSHVPGGGGLSGSVVLAALRDEMVRQGAMFFDVVNDSTLDGLLMPAWAERCHRVLLVDFDRAYAHGDHALKVAPVLLPRMMG